MMEIPAINLKVSVLVCVRPAVQSEGAPITTGLVFTHLMDLMSAASALLQSSSTVNV